MVLKNEFLAQLIIRNKVKTKELLSWNKTLCHKYCEKLNIVPCLFKGNNRDYGTKNSKKAIELNRFNIYGTILKCKNLNFIKSLLSLLTDKYLSYHLN